MKRENSCFCALWVADRRHGLNLLRRKKSAFSKDFFGKWTDDLNTLPEGVSGYADGHTFLL